MALEANPHRCFRIDDGDSRPRRHRRRRAGCNLKVDNGWGRKSSDALADFQGRNGLKVDRRVGDLTWAKLNID
ncbi:peptidoglycan-binding protein [Microbacterium sp. P07]|uniref:peptidoglycan-binding domain-containing protein n=1 Tax=Microbacterium sp. P07 TaxID=3366952 RepID=UPI00374547B7